MSTTMLPTGAAAPTCAVLRQRSGAPAAVPVHRRRCTALERAPTGRRHRGPRRPVHTQAALKPAGGYKSTWKQNTNEVFITLPVPEDVKGGDVGFEVHPKRMVLQIKGEEALSGYFDDKATVPMVEPDGCFWSIETDESGVRAVQVVLEKKEIGHESWESLIEGDGPDMTFTNFAYFDLATEDGRLGTLVFGLYGMVAPKTVLNFVELCRGKSGIQGEDVEKSEKVDKAKEILTYKGSPFHRIIPQFMAQGGDITMGDGSGGKSIFGDTFEDENFTLKHDEAGVLSMANAGPNTNGSQFFILFEPQPHLNGKHTVFGKVIEEESMRTLRLIESLGSESGETSKAVYIKDCGEILGEDMNEFLTNMVTTAPRQNLPDDGTDVMSETEGMTPEMMDEMAKDIMSGTTDTPRDPREMK